MSKEELISMLTGIADASGGDQEATHSHAEEAILEYLNDPEIKAAWEDAAQFWWYA